ncbi:terminase large subunit domain-containing protein [Telmatospirillum sp. J64-1]|uniref:terminase large subunit domain-containing protein n=1 Tax=Telmatospirillum sp. J64-1 TaxID=2502183 RepID=UPI00115CF412|nr:terminase family protein [Telmatospirillum sp. J64-1]
MSHDDDESRSQRLIARNLYWQGESCAQIAKNLGLPYGTVDSWKRRDEWDKTPVVVRIETQIEQRLLRVIAKPDKSERDLAEMDQLTRILERTARIQKYEASGKEGDLNPNIAKRNKGRKKKAEEKNQLTEEQVEQLLEAWDRDLFDYQRRWNEVRKHHRVRNILKSRQIGATWYFAREALIDAITTGDNQIFLSASKAQAHVFRDYIVQFVKDVTGVELKGTPIKLWNGATLYFLGTNSKTAQSYHGHVYLDEYAWISKFLEFRKVASAMATHKKWRITYFSTPSTIGHEANAFWTGESFNKGRPKAERVEIDVSHQALREGALGPDGQWRQIVTIEDAAARGCDLFDIDQLRREYNDQDFANLFMCVWVDDSAAFFTFEELKRCMVDAWEAWRQDWRPDHVPPYDGPVWIGYDPALSQDSASIVVVAPPRVDGGKFRLLEKISFVGVDFQAQAEAIRKLTLKYRVEHIGIDVTTIGQGVFEMVRNFFPAAHAITYSVEVKTRMVLKAKHLISKRLFEFDAGATDVAMAFMSIKKTQTPSGRQATFIAARGRETGHADVAWAVMHAIDRLSFTDFDNDNLPGGTGGRRNNIVEIM